VPCITSQSVAFSALANRESKKICPIFTTDPSYAGVAAGLGGDADADADADTGVAAGLGGAFGHAVGNA